MKDENKGFKLFPEYVWMIFVGMLLVILFLTNAIPGHADDVSPTLTVTPVPTSALDPTDACLPIFVVGSYYLMFDESSSEVLTYFEQYDNDQISLQELLDLAYFSRERFPGDNSAFYRDVKIALTQLSSQFPGFFVSLVDVGAVKAAFDDLYGTISEAGVPISLGYLDYSTNRVLYMANAVYTYAPVWVWNTAIPTPTVTPTPAPQEEYYVLVPPSSSATFKDNYMFTINASGLNGVYVQPQDNTWTSLKTLFPDLTTDLRFNAAVFKTDRYTGSWLGGYFGRTAIFYFQVASYSDVKLYYYRGAVVSDPEVMKSVASVSDGVISESSNYSSPSYYVQQLESGGYCIAFVFRYGEYGDPNFSAYSSDIWFQTYSFSDDNRVNYSLPFQQNSVQYSNSLKLRLDASGTAVPDPNITPTPEPTSTPVPLPTSGESIHVILPTGTPTPTPPFTVSGGSDGGSGSGSGTGSPGSIGSGLSSGQTSGVLQAWTLYVSDNPAIVFLTSTFQALPQELLYPLYILLFILLLLAVIRLFVHFSGG